MILTALTFSLVAQASGFDPGPNPLLMTHPTMNASTIVFEFADDLWSVPRTGGQATRLTSNPGRESDPFFSPDGKTIAFSGEYDGNADVYTVPATGGEPKRLTAHPSPDVPAGWTPDGKSVIFTSPMLSNTDNWRLFTVSAEGGVAKPLPLPTGDGAASYSPDGKRLAYVTGFLWQDAWKRYRGGQAQSIWIAQLSDSKVTPVPKKNEGIFNPMWVGDRIYYISDKGGKTGIYSFAPGSGKVTEEVKSEGFDIKSASAGPGGIVYEQLGSLNLYDFATKKTQRINIEIQGDFPEVRPAIKSLANNVNSLSLSPSGQRLVVGARGHLFSIPATKGQVRELTAGDGIDRRDAAWSPDGKTVAYVSDEHEKQELVLLDLATNKEKFVELGRAPNFYEKLIWSPDSSKIAYTDRRHIVWIHDVKDGSNKAVDSGIYTDPATSIDPRWSPDSKWLTWSRDLDNHLNAVYLYSLESGKSTQITDGLSNAKNPVFDRNGKYLYFFASTNTGQAAAWLDINSYGQPNVTSTVYAVVLKKDGGNPLSPESDEEKPAEEPKKPEAKPDAKAPAKPAPAVSSVDLDNIEHRIIPLPLPTTTYASLEAGPANGVFALATPPKVLATDGNPFGTVWKFSFDSRTAAPFASRILGFYVSPDGSKLALRGATGVSITPAAGPAAAPTPVSLDGIQAKIDPRVEWSRMFHTIWRNEKLLFYDAGLHGVNADELDHRYTPFLANITTRRQLNYLFSDMLGELSIGHMFIGGGDIPTSKSVPGGLLGADYSFENGHYKLTRIYDGERWNPALRAPLAQPGVEAKVGEYVLAIDGQDLTELNDIYLELEGKAGKQVKIKLGPTADGKDSREVIVVPVASEFGLRQRAWTEDNRRRVAEATGGQIGYVHVPDTNVGGWTEFSRFYYAQSDKKGIVVDERFNHGGFANHFMIEEMQRTQRNGWANRYGKDWTGPQVGIFGPKVMLANQFSGSGGDMFPWLFRDAKIGPIIGKRTWGGLVASFGFELVDGGVVRAPDTAFYALNGTWDVEGYGVAPDIEVELDPYLWRQGRDAQLERAILEIQKAMKTYPYAKAVKPKYPDRSKVDIRY